MSKIPDLLEFILAKNGIKDTQKFKNPTRVDIHDPFIFRDMDKASDFIKEIIKKKKLVNFSTSKPLAFYRCKLKQQTDSRLLF